MEEKINLDIKDCILKQQSERLEALRLIKSVIQVEKAKDGKEHLSDEQILKLIQKLVSQSNESASQYSLGGRKDLVDHEMSLISIYKTYLPEQLTIEQITDKVKQLIYETGATTIRDMGKVMALATKEFSGRADNKTIGSIVKSILS
jgi:uncharacterized protein YqeY